MEPKYSGEQKAAAVERVKAVESRRAVAQSIGATETTIRRWCQAASVSSRRTSRRRSQGQPGGKAAKPAAVTSMRNLALAGLRRVPDLPADHRDWVTDLLVRVLDAESRR